MQLCIIQSSATYPSILFICVCVRNLLYSYMIVYIVTIIYKVQSGDKINIIYKEIAWERYALFTYYCSAPEISAWANIIVVYTLFIYLSIFFGTFAVVKLLFFHTQTHTHTHHLRERKKKIKSSWTLQLYTYKPPMRLNRHRGGTTRC